MASGISSESSYTCFRRNEFTIRNVSAPILILEIEIALRIFP